MEWCWLCFSAILSSVCIKRLVDFCLTLYRLPPGPWGLPVVGYLPWLSNQAYKDFVELGKRYGGMFSLRLGGEMAVVLNDWPTVNATLVKRGKAFSARKFHPLTHQIANGQDIAFSEGETWQEHRKITLESLQSVCCKDKSHFESRMRKFINRMMVCLEPLDGQAVVIEEALHDSFLIGQFSVISEIDEEDESKEEFEEFKRDIGVILRTIRLDNPLSALPWLRFLPPDGCGFRPFVRAVAGFKRHIDQLIHRQHQSRDRKNDVIGRYIEIMEDNPDQKPPFNNDYLRGAITDLTFGAIETTFSVILWGFLHLGLNPRVQAKIQDELEEVVGGERLPTTDDFPNLPYLNAFVMELYRMGVVVPLSLPHATTQHVRLQGNLIPKGTLCLTNIYAIHRHPDLWDEPEVFRPERFVTEQGHAKAPPHLIPFSVGPRKCLGQMLAETELRLLFAHFLRKFTFSLPPNLPPPTLESLDAFTRKLRPFALVVHRRK